jgi:methyl-accepting chemotaxis protein
MASLPLGALRATKGGAEVTQSGKTWQGTKDIVGGTAQALTIPSAFMGGPAAEAGADAAGAAGTKIFGSVEKAGKLFNEVATAAKDNPIDLSDEVYDALKNIKQLSDAGAKGTPRVAAKLANRLNNVDEELYWDEARRFYSNISRLSANEYQSMNPQMQRAVGQLGHALGDVLNDTAAGVGKADEYAQAMDLYRTSKAWQQFGSNAWTFLKKAAPYAVGAGAGARLGMSSVASILEK